MATAVHVSSKSAYRGPDPALVKDQLASLQNLFRVYGAEVFCRYLFWILRKSEGAEGPVVLAPGQWNRRLVPFQFNAVQRDLEARMGPRNICLKFRQGGYTTFMIIRRLFTPCILEPGSGGLLVSQDHTYAAAHFGILKRVLRYIGTTDPYDPSQNLLTTQLHQHLLHTQYSNRRELIFDQLESRITCASAEVEEVGQGLTLQHVVTTEVARWRKSPEETLANMKEAIAGGGTLDMESTANGWGGYFFEECMRSRDPKNAAIAEFKYFFHQWWWMEEYRDPDPVDASTLDARETELHTKIGVDLYQMAWRRKKLFSLRHNFPEKYPEDEISCFLVSGKNFFDRDVLALRMLELQTYKPLATKRNGDLVVFSRRLKHRAYIIGADPATGRTVTNEDSDFSAAVVLDLESGEEVAAFRARIAPEDFGFDLDELGREFNMAQIAVERTGDGGSVILTLEVQCGYTNLYMHKEWFKKDRRVIEVLGFPTTPKTRPIALNKLAQFVREYPHLIHDIQFVTECLTFIRDEKGKPQGAPGTHDDTVSARWIGHAARLAVLGYWDPVVAKGEKYGQDAETPQQ